MTRCLVLSARGPLARQVIDGLEAAGHGYGILTTPEAAVNLDVPGAIAAEATPFLRAEPFDPGFLHDLEAWCSEGLFDIVIGADYIGTRLAATLQARGLPLPVFPTAPRETLDLVNDKWRFFETLRAAGIPCPDTWLLHDPRDVEAAPWSYPVITKPRALGGGLLVERIDTPAALARKAAAWPAQQGPMLVQDFVPGHDFDVSVLATEGRLVAWTMQRWQSDRALEMVADHPVLRTVATHAVAATGYSGVAHFDLRIAEPDGQPLMIECNPRFWATLDASIGRGVNFVDLGIRLALGEKVTPSPRARPGFVHYPGPPGHTAAMI